jgi:hypothetical protein
MAFQNIYTNVNFSAGGGTMAMFCDKKNRNEAMHSNFDRRRVITSRSERERAVLVHGWRDRAVVQGASRTHLVASKMNTSTCLCTSVSDEARYDEQPEEQNQCHDARE